MVKRLIIFGILSSITSASIQMFLQYLRFDFEFLSVGQILLSVFITWSIFIFATAPDLKCLLAILKEKYDA